MSYSIFFVALEDRSRSLELSLEAHTYSPQEKKKKTETETWVNILHCLTHFPNKSAPLPVGRNKWLSPFFTLSSKPEIGHHLSLIPFPQEKKNIACKVSTHGYQASVYLQ